MNFAYPSQLNLYSTSQPRPDPKVETTRFNFNKPSQARNDAMWSHRIHDADEIEEAGASIVAGMRLLAEHLDPPTAHALATQLLDDLLRDMMQESSHSIH